MRFETKRDLFFKALIFGPALALTTLSILSYFKAVSIKAMPPTEVFTIGSMLFWAYGFAVLKGTYYEIENGKLIARYAFFKRTVAIHEIRQMSKKSFGNRIYGLSKDIIQIKYGNDKSLNISPENRNEFIGILSELKNKTVDGVK